MNHVHPILLTTSTSALSAPRPPLPPSSELERLVTRQKGHIAVLVFTLIPSVEKPSSQGVISLPCLSLALDGCFGHTIIRRVPALLNMSPWTEKGEVADFV